jgi:hypothetical protein
MAMEVDLLLDGNYAWRVLVTASISPVQILESLKETSGALTSGRPTEEILDCILRAVQALGFDGVRLDLLTADERSITTAASRDTATVLDSVPAADDPILAELRTSSVPRCLESSGSAPERGVVPCVDLWSGDRDAVGRQRQERAPNRGEKP